MKDTVKYALIAVVFAVFLSFLLSYPMMLLWNGCLVPATTILKEVSWLQMWGIVILFNVIFKTHSLSKE